MGIRSKNKIEKGTRSFKIIIEVFANVVRSKFLGIEQRVAWSISNGIWIDFTCLWRLYKWTDDRNDF